jgi:hypothetical protein
MNVQFIDADNCEIVDFDIKTDKPSDALERSEVLFDMGKFRWEEVKKIVITE